MKTIRDYLAEKHPAFLARFDADNLEKGSVSMGAFLDHGLPMVVSCTGCEMTMTLTSLSVNVDDDDCVWCQECGDSRGGATT
jgi:predicted  nucleic acid-binding Zn-ribbon protein